MGVCCARCARLDALRRAQWRAGRAVRDDARLKVLAVARGLAPDDVDALDDD